MARVLDAGSGSDATVMAVQHDPARVVAHIAVVESDPPPNAQVPQPAGDVHVTFDAGLADASRLQVIDSSFQRVDQGSTRIENERTLVVGVAPEAAGWLTVQYDAVALDGHTAAGTYALEVVAAPGLGGAIPLAIVALVLLWVVVRLRTGALRRRVSSAAVVCALTVPFAVGCASSTTATEPGAEAIRGLGPVGTSEVGAPTSETLGEATPGSAASVVLAASDLAIGPSRFAFALLDEHGALIEDAAVGVTFFRLLGESARPDSEKVAVYFPGAIAGSGLYVTRIEFATGGLWGAEMRPRLAGGEELAPQRVRFEVAQKPRSPAVGSRPPSTVNPTVDPATAPKDDLAAISSDLAPDPELYAMTVDDAAASGRPTVVVFATPGYCQTDLCAPVLDEMKQVKRAWSDRVNFIHIEVYGSFDPLVLSPLMDTWGLNTEPWVFVLDADGTVVDRLEGNVTAAELEPIVASLVGPSS